MVTRFSAEDARTALSVALLRQKELKNFERTNKEKAKKEQKRIESSWNSQRINLIVAALDGKSELATDSVCLYKDLISLGFYVVESGFVQKLEIPKTFDQLNALCDSRLRNLSERYKSFSKKLVSEAKKNGIKFNASELDGLAEGLDVALNSKFHSGKLSPSNICFDCIPDNIKNSYANEFLALSEKIAEYKDLRDHTIPEFDDSLPVKTKRHNGEYCYSELDEDKDFLEVSDSRNSLHLRWSNSYSGNYMNHPLFSYDGLSWLASSVGQELISSVFGAISESANSGRKTHTLNFKLDSIGWNYSQDDSEFFSCMPDDFIEILKIEKFSIDDTKSTKNSYSIKLSW